MERRRARTRQALLDAGIATIAERGLDRLTIANITDGADVALGSFYNHFENREDFLKQLSETALAEWMDDVRTMRCGPFATEADRVAVSFVVLSRRAVADPKWARFTSESLARSEVPTTVQLRATLLSVVELGIEQGVFEVDNPDATSWMVLGVLRQCLIRLVDEPSNAQASEHAFTTTVLRMLGADPTRLADIVDRAISQTAHYE